MATPKRGVVPNNFRGALCAPHTLPPFSQNPAYAPVCHPKPLDFLQKNYVIIKLGIH